LAQNCAALPESLLEGILFGTSKGGFTGAIDRPGLFEQANGGTLLLDEINSMPYELQAKLLRVLQEGYIRRVGGMKDIPIDVRIIATTNEQPSLLVDKGILRKDLYYRLNIIPINVPPLRARKVDIVPLSERFIKKYNEIYEKEVWLISDKAKEKLINYSWPGNVRELENTIMAALSMIDDEHVINENNILLPETDNSFVGATAKQIDISKKNLNQILEEIEMSLIMDSLKEKFFKYKQSC
jgi:Transcriptional regulator containing PAS, AAA-type ATPase, and DNA-binding domains